MTHVMTEGMRVRRVGVLLGLGVAMLAAAVMVGCSSTPGTAKASAAVSPQPAGAATTAGPDSDGDGLPDSAEVLLGTDPHNPDTDGDGQNDKVDKDPLQAVDPIKETSVAKGFKIDSVIAENNVDAAGAAAADHLEITVTNTSGSDITNGWDLYYSLTDTVTNVVQSFYMPLPGFAVKAGQTVHLHVDTSGQPGHFAADPNSAFYKGQNKLAIAVELHATGFAPESATTKKDAAGAEAGGD